MATSANGDEGNFLELVYVLDIAKFLDLMLLHKGCSMHLGLEHGIRQIQAFLTPSKSLKVCRSDDVQSPCGWCWCLQLIQQAPTSRSSCF